MSKDNFYKNPTLMDLPKELPFPKQIGEYKIESLLNKGGMSLLYLGIHPETHEPLAIKVLLAKYVSNPKMVERFMREAAIIQLTNHPNIIKLHGYGKWEGGVYIAMEFVQGISLRQMILQEAMSFKRALEVSLQIGHALVHLHAHGIIHRDLKPENILLTAQGGVKVIDFGISQIYTEKNDLTNSSVLGTPVYMSPEQKHDPLHVSFSTDIYSLGIITYELILGRLCHGVIHLSLVPRSVQKILAKALQPKPEDRYEDIIDFIKAVSTYLASSEWKQEMRGSDYLGEFNEQLKVAQSVLMPQKPPVWPSFDLALVSNFSIALSSAYYDFFQSKEGVYHIVIGESLTTGVEGLLQISVLKGMVHAWAQTKETPTEFITALNNQLVKEGAKNTFSFALLTLFPHKETISYISFGRTSLWYIPEGIEAPQKLTAENPALGSALLNTCVEMDANLYVADRLVLYTMQEKQIQAVEEVTLLEAQFVETLRESIFLSPQKQVEAIFRKLSQNEKRTFSMRPATVISIERVK